ncbi:MAG: T9SS type A sorting domain-containing protein [Chitinophagaceae bacterium]|nr:MAG: T9SS type A sorting domain-containing protein [Chitinophagaceae bacterium]
MRNVYSIFRFVILSTAVFTSSVRLSAQNPVLSYSPVVSGLTSPVDAATAPGDGRLFIAQQNGLIRIRNGAALSTFANLGPAILTTGNEQGLLSLAFHPQYATNRYFFVLYTAATTGAITLARYRRDAADPNTIEAGGTVLLTIPKPSPLSSYSNHNGGKLPWRWSFDRLTGDMWIGDVGQSAWEEVNWKPAGQASGGNFGWKCYEGNHVYSSCTLTDTISPVFEYNRDPATGGTSITGGIVYRGTASPAMQGFYIVTDYVSGNLWKIRPNGSGGWQVFPQYDLDNLVAGFAEGPTGELYAINRGDGRIDSVTVLSVLPVTISQFTATPAAGFNQLTWTTTAEVNTSRFHIEYSTNGTSFARVGEIAAAGNSTGRQYSYRHNNPQMGNAYYRLAMQDADGSIAHSEIVRIKSGSIKPFSIAPTIITNLQLNLQLAQPAEELQLISTSGAVMFSKNLRLLSGNQSFLLPALPKGMYVVRVITGNNVVKEKIVIQ